MVRLFSVADGQGQKHVTVWADDLGQAREIAQAEAGLIGCLSITDLTPDQVDPDNPYRDYALRVMSERRRGVAHLRIGPDEQQSGWIFTRLDDPTEPRAA